VSEVITVCVLQRARETGERPSAYQPVKEHSVERKELSDSAFWEDF
jgi:hypothetical protein